MLCLSAVLAGAALFWAPSSAQATYTINVYDDGVLQGGIVVLPAGNSLIFQGTTTHFSITNGSGSSNNPGSQGGSFLSLGTSETIESTFGATGGTHTIRVELTQTGWLAPVGSPLTLTASSAGGGQFSIIQGMNPLANQAVTVTYEGFLDNTNTAFGQPVAGSTGVITASASGSSAGANPLVFSPSSSANVVPGGTPFSMTDVLEFTFTLGAGSGTSSAGISVSTVAAVPAPAAAVLAVVGAPFLGVGAWLRRRRKVS